MVDHNPTPTKTPTPSPEAAPLSNKQDADGLIAYEDIRSQEQLRKIVETARANGVRSGMDAAHSSFSKRCKEYDLNPAEATLSDLLHAVGGRAGLTGQEDGHAEGYAKAMAETGPIRDAIADLGAKLLEGPSGKLQSQNDSLRSELAACRTHIAELTARLDKTKAPASVSIHVNEGATVNVHPHSEHAP